MSRRKHAPPIEDVGDVTARLAVLLAAGVPPAAAWRYLLPEITDDERADAISRPRPPGAPVIAAAIRAAGEGDSISAAVARSAGGEEPGLRSAWCGLAAAWFVATESGAPLAQCLRQLACAFQALGQTQRDLQVALAGPAATARLVMALPVVGVLFGLGLGFNTWQTLFGSAPGLVCLTVGVLLMVVGVLWNRRMIRRATPTDVTPGLCIDLTAMAMAGGGSVDRARRLVGEAVNRYGIVDAHASLIDGVVDLSSRAGVPAAELLHGEADRARREARTTGQEAAATLAVRLMLPLGVCVLPAFMLLGVAPLLLAIISSTVASI
ncbi:type II secretion system F family protein [Rathayibacter soli]|uniref:type II secretion system F family protein n=1 Tax=Rathayibacter soli TaxID=3144168 RepID=UPI0027E5A3D0|nr:type II secretion system F family protein [Glaciibacter superstes]